MSRRAGAALLPLVLLALLAGCEDQPQLLLIGHRGSPWTELENSLAAFRAAYEQGADGVEFDVQQSRDGKIIVMHDETLDRTTRCSGEVAARSLVELASCSLDNGEPIRLLADVLKTIGPRFEIMFLELKVPEVKVPTDAAIRTYTDAVIEIVKASDHADKVVLISYSVIALRRIAERQGEGILAGWDDGEGESVALARRWEMPWSLMPVRSITPALGAVAAGLGQRVAVYQVDSPAQFLAAEDAGVRAMMADNIHQLCSLSGRRPRDAPTW